MHEICVQASRGSKMGKVHYAYAFLQGSFLQHKIIPKESLCTRQFSTIVLTKGPLVRSEVYQSQ